MLEHAGAAPLSQGKAPAHEKRHGGIGSCGKTLSSSFVPAPSPLLDELPLFLKAIPLHTNTQEIKRSHSGIVSLCPSCPG